MTQTNYRGEGYPRMEGCTLQGHYRELRVLCDALEYAAQLEQTAAVEEAAEHIGRLGEISAGAQPVQGQVSRRQHGMENARGRIEAWGGTFAGYGKLLRAVEGSLAELTDTERAMLQRIDWYAEGGPVFNFPGREVFDVASTVEPGEYTTGHQHDWAGLGGREVLCSRCGTSSQVRHKRPTCWGSPRLQARHVAQANQRTYERLLKLYGDNLVRLHGRQS